MVYPIIIPLVKAGSRILPVKVLDKTWPIKKKKKISLATNFPSTNPDQRWFSKCWLNFSVRPDQLRFPEFDSGFDVLRTYVKLRWDGETFCSFFTPSAGWAAEESRFHCKLRTPGLAEREDWNTLEGPPLNALERPPFGDATFWSIGDNKEVRATCGWIICWETSWQAAFLLTTCIKVDVRPIFFNIYQFHWQ